MHPFDQLLLVAKGMLFVMGSIYFLRFFAMIFSFPWSFLQ
jgi:hypothetical protein